LGQATQGKYAYTYGKKETSSDMFDLAISSVMRTMEETINLGLINPLIDWNFGTQAYPKLKLVDTSPQTKNLLTKAFDIIKDKKVLPEEFTDEVLKKVSEQMGLEWSKKEEKEENVEQAFERGKISAANDLKKPAPTTSEEIKDKLKKLSGDNKVEKAFELGYEFSQKSN
jgi:hypothetical protein